MVRTRATASREPTEVPGAVVAFRPIGVIFAIMPWMFMFMLGTFASGLVIYWCANNIITFTQQYTIMRSQGVKVDFLGHVAKTFKKKPKEG